MTATSHSQPGKFIDPLSDWGFRHYFDSEPNKEILIEFLNDLFEGERHIETLERGPTENDGDSEEDKRVIFDLHCRGSNGEYFIIENLSDHWRMQRIRQEYFKDRALYYTSRLIQRQLPKGKAVNSYQLPEVFLIAFLEFRMEEKQRSRYFHDIALCNKSTGEIPACRQAGFTKSWALNSLSYLSFGKYLFSAVAESSHKIYFFLSLDNFMLGL